MTVDNLISEALDSHILSLEDERELDGKYHPSSMFMCARATILAVRGIKATSVADAQAKRVFRIGHLYHELVQAALPGHPQIAAVYPEFKIDVPEWNIVGAGDALIQLTDMSWYLIEIKSTKSLRYTPKDDHVKQASVYFTAARDFGWESTTGFAGADINGPFAPLGDSLKGIILVYLNKNDLAMKEYPYKYDPKWRPAIEKRVKELDKYRLVQIEDLPKPLPLDKGKPNWYTNYCPYRGSGMCCGDKEEDYDW